MPKTSSTIETFPVVGLIVPRLAALALGVVRDSMREVPPAVRLQVGLVWSLVTTNTEVHKGTDPCRDDPLQHLGNELVIVL